MSLEGFSKRGMELGNNPEGIKDTINNVRQDYLNAVKRLALQKIKNDLMYEGMLGATIRRFSSLGLDVSRESISRDIEVEVNRQKTDLDFDIPDLSIESSVDINQLKNNLGNIFQSTPEQSHQTISRSASIPREPAIESVIGAEMTTDYNMRQLSEIQETKEQIPVHTEEEKQVIRTQMQQAQEELTKTLEWAKQQSNEPIFTSTRSESISASPDWTKDTGISGYTEPSIEQVRNGLEQADKEQNFDDVYEFELQKLTELKKNNNPNYETELNSAIAKISSLTDKIPNIRGQLESDIEYEMKTTIQNQQQEVVSIPIQEQVESEKILQEQQQSLKNKMIDQIMNGMNMAGEFSFGDISMSERMNIMQNVQNKLNAKSIDELQMLLATYQQQNVQEEIKSSGMHR